MNEELDSQLSAMFDDELPATECELLARRLSRDEPLKARWGRYALIGAVLRAERGVVLQSAVAGRVNAALTHEPLLAAAGGRLIGSSWMRLISGAGLAAGVAALSILWLRSHAVVPTHTTPALAMATAGTPSASQGSGAAHNLGVAHDSYVVPPNAAQPMTPMPPTQLADYVVAHSAYSWPISGGSLLSSLMVSEPASLRPPVGSHGRAAGQGHAIAPAH